MKISVLLLLAMIFILTACSALDNFLAGESPAAAPPTVDPNYINNTNSSVERIIADFIQNNGMDIPLFPTYDYAPHRPNDMTNEEYEELMTRTWNEHLIEIDEWFDLNGDSVVDILKAVLSQVNSSFSYANFSISQFEHNDMLYRIIYADVPVDLISDLDMIYLLHAVRGLTTLGGGMSQLSFPIKLNLNNGNQLFFVGRDNITYTISYREQENETANTTSLDWWSIAVATVVVTENTITWQGFVEDNDGNFSIRPLSRSPFE